MSEAPSRDATGSPEVLGNALSHLSLAPSTTGLLDLPAHIICVILAMFPTCEDAVIEEGCIASLCLTCSMMNSLVLARATRMVFHGTNKQTGEFSSLPLRLLQAMPNLQLLDLRRCQDLSLSLVGLPPTIKILEMKRTLHYNAGMMTDPLLDLSPLSKCEGLKKLDISFCRNRVVDLSPLAACKHLHKLDICGCLDLTSLSSLAQCTNLRHINLGRTSIADLCPLSACKELETIMCCNSKVIDLSPLSVCSKLWKVHCSHTIVSDLSPLSVCSKLMEIDCSDTAVSDLSPLSACLKLEWVNCKRTSVRDITSLADLPHLDTIQCDRDVNGLSEEYVYDEDYDKYGELPASHPAFPEVEIDVEFDVESDESFHDLIW
eukprot:gene21744-biopygen30438